MSRAHSRTRLAAYIAALALLTLFVAGLCVLTYLRGARDLLQVRQVPLQFAVGARDRAGRDQLHAGRAQRPVQERDVVGCQGVFNMSPTNHNGMDERARVLVTVKDGRFRLLPE